MSFMKVNDIRVIHNASVTPASQTLDTKDIALFCHQIVFTRQGGDVIKTAAQEAGIKIYGVKAEKPILRDRKPIQMADVCFFVMKKDWPRIKQVAEKVEVMDNGKFWKTIWKELNTSGLPDPLPDMGATLHVLGLVSADDARIPVREKTYVTFSSEVEHPEKAAEARLLQIYSNEIAKSIQEFNR